MQRFDLWLRGRPWLVDLALVAVLVVPPLAGATADRGPVWAQALICGLLALPLLWRRRHPLTVAVLVATVAWAQYASGVFGHSLQIANLALNVALYQLVVIGRRRAATVFAVVIGTFYATWALTRYSGPDARLGAFCFLAMVALAWVAGEYVRSRRAYRGEVERHAALTESRLHALARAAVAEERNRIARELHDVLAHSVSVMVVHAEGARLMRHSNPAAVDDALETISTTGRTALTELRRVLEVLHVNEADRRPQPALTDLRRLVTQAGAGRAPIELTVTGAPADLPASATLQTYRIVQEALTNVIKHAPAAAGTRVAVDVGVTGPGRRIRIEVVNGGGPGAPPVEPVRGLPSAGRGLAGMRERVGLFAGTLEAGPTGDGGYRLTATLPLDQPAEPVVTP